jgi:hypothetical protein
MCAFSLCRPFYAKGGDVPPPCWTAHGLFQHPGYTNHCGSGIDCYYYLRQLLLHHRYNPVPSAGEELPFLSVRGSFLVALNITGRISGTHKEGYPDFNKAAVNFDDQIAAPPTQNEVLTHLFLHLPPIFRCWMS